MTAPESWLGRPENYKPDTPPPAPEVLMLQQGSGKATAWGAEVESLLGRAKVWKIGISTEHVRIKASSSRRLAFVIALATLCALLVFLWGSASAQGAVTHKYEPEPSQVLSAGIPEVGPKGEKVALPGNLSGVDSMTVDEGHLWVAEDIEGESSRRVDEFDVATGAFRLQFPLSGEPRGIAVNAGQVYVGSGVGVSVFSEATGSLLGTWSGGDTPGGSEGFAGEQTGVAVDSSTLDPDHGDVYVSDAAQKVVDVFKPEAAGGEKYITQLTGTCTTGMGCAPSESFASPRGVAVNPSNGDLLVADESAVDVFAPESSFAGVYKFLFKITGTPNGTYQVLRGVAVSAGTGEIYVWGQEEHEGVITDETFIDEFNAAGGYEGRLTGTPEGSFTGVRSVAIDDQPGASSFEDVYVGNHGFLEPQGLIDVFGGPLLLPNVTIAAVAHPGSTSATLTGTVDPLGLPVSSCEFEYGTSTSYGSTAACVPMPGSGSVAETVTASVKDLLSGTTYHFRLEAGNANGPNTSLDGEFKTTGPTLDGESAADVASTSVTLDATITPNGTPTTYHFEYDTSAYTLGEAAHGTSVPVPDESIGSGTEPLQVAPRHIQGLQPGTVYHYRVVAISVVEGRPETFDGADHAFTTQTVGSGVALPDGRQYELVSPPDKHGALIQPIAEVGVVQAARAGDAFSYVANIPTESGVQGYAQAVQVISERGTGGWSSQDVALPHAEPSGAVVGVGDEFRLFSPELSDAVVEPFGEFTSLAPDVFPADTERTPYLRHDSTCASTPATCFRPLVTSAAGYANVPSGTVFGGEFSSPQSAAIFVGASEDLAHVVVASGVALTEAPIPARQAALYEWSGDEPPARQLQPVSVLPADEGGNAVSGVLGEINGADPHPNARGAISDDGSRVFWTAHPNAGDHLYMRDLAKDEGRGETVKLDAPEPECLARSECGKGPVRPRFQFANSDGSEVFFTDEQRLTAGSGAGTNQRDLYECAIVERAGRDECKLHDLTPVTAGQKAEVQGLALANEDDSYLYFVANGKLAEGAMPGQPNLYLFHEGTTRLVAVLSSEDDPDWGGPTELTVDQTARVSPDGRYLAFMSDRSLTGYDNLDANSQMPDEEVFLFDAATGRTVCASCNPTGGRPVGLFDTGRLGELPLVIGQSSLWAGRWLAANIPGWTPFESYTARYQSRYLSDEGRLFFNSNDALVPQDINNNEDVYQYEPPANGEMTDGDSCSASSATFSVRGEGCISLISSGTAAGESAFLDASENGDDVFFLTGERLVPQDTDTSFDVYDAHVCSAASPCTSAAVSPPGCTTADACRAAPVPQPEIFGSPSSATFAGQGNATPAAAPVAKRSLTRAQKLAAALKVCRRDRKRAKRTGCEKQARRKYGPLKAKSKKKK